MAHVYEVRAPMSAPLLLASGGPRKLVRGECVDGSPVRESVRSDVASLQLAGGHDRSAAAGAIIPTEPGPGVDTRWAVTRHTFATPGAHTPRATAPRARD